MARMPIRTRTHVLEDESRKYFRSLLPSQWVVRDKGDDYGIDSEVEIFDECGSATGLVFLVQLKGSDNSSAKDKPKARVEVSTFNYWRSLELPVLLVKYYAQTKTVYAQWTNTFDTHHVREDQKTFQIPFFESNLWQDSTCEKLRNDVELFRQIRLGQLPFPITLAIVRDDSILNGVPGALIDSGIRNILSQLPAKFRIAQSTDPDPNATIFLSNKKTSVTFGGIIGFTVHFYSDTNRGDTAPDYVNDTMACLGIALALVNQQSLSAQFLKKG